MNIVLDTNVLVSAIIFGGKPRVIIELVIDQEVVGYITEEIIQEVLETLARKFRQSKSDLHKAEDLLRNVFTLVSVTTIPSVVRDPKDNHVLAITDEATIGAIISGDKDLVTLKHYNGIPIMTTSDFLTKYDFDTEG